MMKTFATALCALLLLGVISNVQAADKLHHVVCLKFKSTATPQEIQQNEQAFQGLKEKIPQVLSLQWGTNVSKEKLAKGFTHCFVLSFKSEQDCATYIAHPAHKAFSKNLGPILDDVFVIDFWAKDYTRLQPSA